MKPRRLFVSDLALSDFREVRQEIEVHSPEQAKKFVSNAYTAAERIARLGLTGRPRPERGRDVRSVPFGRYLFFLRATDDELQILRFVHSARDLRKIRLE